MLEGCVNLIVVATSMKTMGSLLPTPSHMKWDTSMFIALHCTEVLQYNQMLANVNREREL